MSVVAADLVQYGAANRPEDDTSTAGGAQDATARPIDSPMASSSNIEIVSDGADTRGFTVRYRDPAGAIQTWASTLNGTTPVTLGATAERIIDVVLASTDGARTVTLRFISAGATIHTINPNEDTGYRLFISAPSSASPETYYEKTFWENTDGTFALTDAEVTLTADPDTLFRIGLATSKDDSGTSSNRKTAPGGVSFVDDGVAASVPTGYLAPSEAIGVWIEMALSASQAAGKTTFTTQLAGQST